MSNDSTLLSTNRLNTVDIRAEKISKISQTDENKVQGHDDIFSLE